MRPDLIKDLAEQGDLIAQFQLGLAYAKGDGVPHDYKSAIAWWLKAAEHGNISAQVQLGILYAKGEGVLQDYEEAAKWYRKAAEQGDAASQNLLGVLYSLGKGVPRDCVKSYFWLTLASAQKHDIIAVRDAVGSDLTSDQREEVEARCATWLRELEAKSTGRR
ncbi:MAG TPA: tetratricopeptide repeat protein [Candidatus Ozemobacteraceae bacterium]|nr:tetratricopeptide repeat protein [Candidatus Ozemobacteraceae bacterium]